MLDRVKQLGWGNVETLRKERNGRQGWQAMAVLDCAYKPSRKRPSQLRLRQPFAAPEPLDLSAQASGRRRPMFSNS
jgi:hypothetical protein